MDKTSEIGNRILTDSVFLIGGETKTSIVSCIQDGKLYAPNENEQLINEFLLGNIEAVNHFSGYKVHITDGFDEGYLEELLHPAYYLDVDNDNDKELILYDLYGTKYIDSMDGTVVLFESESPSSKLSFVEYDGVIWIAECDLSHDGRENRVFRKYKGAYNIEDSFTLDAFWDMDENTYDQNSEFYYNDKQISMAEYKAKLNDIFGD